MTKLLPRDGVAHSVYQEYDWPLRRIEDEDGMYRKFAARKEVKCLFVVAL